MAVFDKLMFWKKKPKDDFSDMGMGDMGKDIGAMGPPPGTETPGGDMFGAQEAPAVPAATDSFGAPQAPPTDMGAGQPMQPQQQPPPAQGFSGPMPSQPYSVSSAQSSETGDTGQQSYVTNKNLEVLSSKLDALKSAIDSMSQRIENIERMAHGEHEKRRREW